MFLGFFIFLFIFKILYVRMCVLYEFLCTCAHRYLRRPEDSISECPVCTGDWTWLPRVAVLLTCEPAVLALALVFWNVWLCISGWFGTAVDPLHSLHSLCPSPKVTFSFSLFLLFFHFPFCPFVLIILLSYIAEAGVEVLSPWFTCQSIYWALYYSDYQFRIQNKLKH